ncbi:PREDICTED: cubilin-like isoform X1 [Cercocebus atys]|uniref:cubilin-like isoform X1 n=1 Tax=Cercocebus atys TaxID=9531 RepID=UPI0005F3C0AC|nr:PREDICTED: cubilin-like isoform X1 [Cercocebus atys]
MCLCFNTGPQQGCGGYMTGSNNIFAFPDSDSNGIYDKNLNCVWIIIPPINKLIHLTFNTFALEAASTRQRCLYDHVKLYYGVNENANLAGTFCRSAVPALFIYSGNFLMVQFVSDLTLEREGFNATYTIMDRSWKFKNSVVWQKCFSCASVLFFYEYCNCHFKSGVLNRNSRMSFTYQIADCNRDYHKAFGNLRSPGWPDNYDNDMDCTITLTAPPEPHHFPLFSFVWH